MHIKKFNLKKLGLIIGLLLIVVVAGVTIWGGSSGWLQGALYKISNIGVQPKTQIQNPTLPKTTKTINSEILTVKTPPILELDEQTQIKRTLERANIAVLEFAADDPARGAQGNVNLDTIIKNFYKSHTDNFDMLITMSFQETPNDLENNYLNGATNGNMHLNGASNIGKKNGCGMLTNPTCSGYPSKLKYTQQCNYQDWETDGKLSNICRHEILHYWGNGWANGDHECFDPWAFWAFENGHWTQLFSAGPFSSTHTYPVNLLESMENPPTAELLDVPQFGLWIDNNDDTFTFHAENNPPDRGFNYIDLYQMGLLSESELSQKELFVVLNPQLIGRTEPVDGIRDRIYTGTRKNITLDDLKSLLLQREQCENTGPNYYYTGDGSRVPEILPETALDFRVAFVIIKYPEQKITQKDAQRLCKLINYTTPEDWYYSSRLNADGNGLRSIMNTYFSNITRNPDCESLFPADINPEISVKGTTVDDEFLKYDIQNNINLNKFDLSKFETPNLNNF
jgi:hypothetical protein